MNTHESEDGMAGVRLHESGLLLGELDLQGGAAFWDEVMRFTELAEMEDLVVPLQTALPVPRVWVFLDTPERTGSRAAAALAVARVLWRKGQKILVLDGDDRRPDLTRWAGCFEREGWIDCVRFGASLSSCGIPLPWEGDSGRFLGVGSFCPTDVTPEEMHQLVVRLRGQADDLLIAAPLNDLGKIWCAEADVRLLCWDRTTRSQTATEALIAGLAAGGASVDALVGFGPSPQEWPPVAPAGAPGPGPIRASGAATGSVAGVGESAMEAGGDRQRDFKPAPLPPEEIESPRSSRFFRGMAIVLALLVVLLGSWWFGVRRQGVFQIRQRPAPVAAHPNQDRPGQHTTGPAANGRALPAGVEAEQAAGGLHSAGQDTITLGPTAEALGAPPAVAEDSTSRGTLERVTARQSAAASPGQTPAAGAGPAATTKELGTEAIAEPAPEPGTQAGAQVPAGPSTPGDPYQLPVGSEGWALHVFSLPDSSQAQKEVARVQKRGIRAVWRAVELPEKGLWYRVFVGSFPSREAALAAMPELKQRLGVDWAMPKRFSR